MSKVVKGIKATLVSRAINITVNAALIVLLSRYLLGPDSYGVLYLTLSIFALSQLFADLGIARSAARYVAEYSETNRPQIPHIIRLSLTFRLLLIGFVATIILLSRGIVSSFLNESVIGVLMLLGPLYLLGHSLNNYNISIFQGFGSVQYSALASITDYVSRIIFIPLFIALGWGVVGALIGYVVSGVLAAIVGLIILYTHFYSPINQSEKVEKGLRRRIIEYSIPLTASRGANIIDRRIDIILTGFFLGPVYVSFYTVAKQLSDFAIAPADSIGFALSPTYGEKKANNRDRRAAQIYESSLQYVLLVYIPATVGLLLIAEPLVLLIFSESYAEAVPLVKVFSIYILFRAIASVTTQATDYLGQAKYRAIIKAFTSISNLCLNILLIPRIGVIGAAISTTLTFGVYTICNMYIMHTILPLQYRELLRVGSGTAVISLIMGTVILAVSAQITGLLTLGGVILLGVLVWAALASVSGLLDVRETLSLLT